MVTGAISSILTRVPLVYSPLQRALAQRPEPSEGYRVRQDTKLPKGLL